MSAKSPNPKDQRVQRTDQRLRDAFISLVHERGYEAVAIRDVVERAGVGRSTFYTHYGDLEELHGRWLNDFVAHNRGQRPLLDFTHSFLAHAHGPGRAWHRLGGRQRRAAVQKQLRQNLVALAREEVVQIAPKQKPAAIEAISRYLAGAFAELLFWWLDSPTALSPVEIDGIFRRLTTSALDAIQHAPLSPLRPGSRRVQLEVKSATAQAGA